MEEDVALMPLKNVLAPLGGGYSSGSWGAVFGGEYDMGRGYGGGYGRSSCGGGYGDMSGIWRPHRHAPRFALASPIRRPTVLPPSTSLLPCSPRRQSSGYGGSGGGVDGCYDMGRPGYGNRHRCLPLCPRPSRTMPGRAPLLRPLPRLLQPPRR